MGVLAYRSMIGVELTLVVGRPSSSRPPTSKKDTPGVDRLDGSGLGVGRGGSTGGPCASGFSKGLCDIGGEGKGQSRRLIWTIGASFARIRQTVMEDGWATCATSASSTSGSMYMPALRVVLPSLGPGVGGSSRLVEDDRLIESIEEATCNLDFLGARSRTNDPRAKAFEAAVAMKISRDAHRLRNCWLPRRSTTVGMR